MEVLTPKHSPKRRGRSIKTQSNGLVGSPKEPFSSPRSGRRAKTIFSTLTEETGGVDEPAVRSKPDAIPPGEKRPTRNASIAATKVIKEATAPTKRRTRDSVGVKASGSNSTSAQLRDSNIANDSGSSIHKSRLRSKRAGSSKLSVTFDNRVLKITGLTPSKLEKIIHKRPNTPLLGSARRKSNAKVATTLVLKPPKRTETRARTEQPKTAGIIILDRSNETPSVSSVESAPSENEDDIANEPAARPSTAGLDQTAKPKKKSENPELNLQNEAARTPEALTSATQSPTRATKSLRTEALAQNSRNQSPVGLGIRTTPEDGETTPNGAKEQAQSASSRPQSHVSLEAGRSSSRKRKRRPISDEYGKPDSKNRPVSPVAEVETEQPPDIQDVDMKSKSGSENSFPGKSASLSGVDQLEVGQEIANSEISVPHGDTSSQENHRNSNNNGLPTLSVDNLRQHDIQLLHHSDPLESSFDDTALVDAVKNGPTPVDDAGTISKQSDATNLVRQDQEEAIFQDRNSTQHRTRALDDSPISPTTMKPTQNLQGLILPPDSTSEIVDEDKLLLQALSEEYSPSGRYIGNEGGKICGYCGEIKSVHNITDWQKHLEWHDARDDGSAAGLVSDSEVSVSSQGSAGSGTRKKMSDLLKALHEQRKIDELDSQSDTSSQGEKPISKRGSSAPVETVHRPLCDDDLPLAYMPDTPPADVLVADASVAATPPTDHLPADAIPADESLARTTVQSIKKFRPLPTAENFVKALDNPEQRSTADLFVITENVVDALAAWQAEWTALDATVAAATNRKARNPLDPQDPIVWDDKKEADLYGFRYDPNPIKVGAQDIFGQRYGRHLSGRELRRRGRGKREWNALIEYDDDGTGERRSRGRPRRTVRATTEFSEASMFDSVGGSQRNDYDTPAGSPAPRRRGRGRGANANIHSRIRDLRDGDTASVFSTESEGSPAPQKRRGRPSKLEKERMVAASINSAVDGETDVKKPKSAKRSAAMAEWWSKRKQKKAAEEADGISESGLMTPNTTVTNRGATTASRGRGSRGGRGGGRGRGSTRGNSSTRGRGGKPARARGGRARPPTWIEPRPIESAQNDLPMAPITPTRIPGLTEYERFQMLASGEGSEDLGRGRRRALGSMSISASGTPIQSQGTERPALQSDNEGGMSDTYGDLVDTPMADEDEDEDNDGLAKYHGFVDDDSNDDDWET